MTWVWRKAFSITVALAIGLGMPVDALAARPRSSVNIRSSLVKLSDLFSGLEAGQDCIIGPAPVPGNRLIIEQLQLAAIAAQFGVDWQPGIVPVQVVIERQARSITRADLMPLVRSALEAAGAPLDSDISLGAYSTMAIPAEITGPPDITSMTYDRTSGRFSVQLVFDAPGADLVRLRVDGLAEEMVDVPALSHAMGAGEVIAAADLQVKRLRKSMINDQTVIRADDAVGLAVRHRMTTGDLLSVDGLSHPLLVSRGMSVILRLEATGLVLTAKGEAIEDGALNERIHVLNPVSRAVLVARVTGPASVQVDPMSAPIMLASQQSGLPTAYSLNAMTQAANQNGSVR